MRIYIETLKQVLYMPPVLRLTYLCKRIRIMSKPRGIHRGVANVRHFRHVSTHNVFPKMFLLMKNDKQRITYFNYVCFMFIVLMTSFHKLKDKICNEYCDLN